MVDVFFLDETNYLIFEINRSELFSLTLHMALLIWSCILMFNACNTKFVICKTWIVDVLDYAWRLNGNMAEGVSNLMALVFRTFLFLCLTHLSSGKLKVGELNT